MTNATANQKKRAAVIGSGFGGLACAIRMQAAGFDVEIFEKRDQPGGRAYVYRDQGFTFDAGPTVITAPQCLEDLFTVAGRRMDEYVELMPVNPFYRLFWEDGYVFDYSNDLEGTLRQIRAKSPESGELDAQGYLDFLKYAEEVFHEGYTKLSHVPFLHWSSMVRVAPQLIRLGAHRSVYNTVSRYVRDPQLRQAFSFHSLLVGGNPFSTSSIYTLIHFLERNWGVHFPKGGTGALVQGLIRLFEDMGGRLRLNAEIDRIMTDRGAVQGIRMKDGETLPFDCVVSNADVVHTYETLLRGEDLAKRPARKLAKSRHSMSLFLIYFGAKKKWPNLAHHNVIFGPRYKELLEDIFHYGELADDFSLYLHAPSISDPDLAPPGCEGFYVLSPVPHKGLNDADWKDIGPKYAQRILDYLDARYLPGLKENLVTQRIFTPDDFKSELNAHWGAAFSLEPILTQSAYFRVHNRDDKIKGMYFVGAGTHPGAGVPGVVGSAQATAGLVIEDLGAGLAPRVAAVRAGTSATRRPEPASEAQI